MHFTIHNTIPTQDLDYSLLKVVFNVSIFSFSFNLRKFWYIFLVTWWISINNWNIWETFVSNIQNNLHRNCDRSSYIHDGVDFFGRKNSFGQTLCLCLIMSTKHWLSQHCDNTITVSWLHSSWRDKICFANSRIMDGKILFFVLFFLTYLVTRSLTRCFCFLQYWPWLA